MARKDSLKKLFSRKKVDNVSELASSKPTELIGESVSEQSIAAVSAANTVERYSLIGQDAFANIVRDPSRGNLTYIVEEPKLTKDDAMQMEHLKGLLMEILDVHMSKLDSKEAARSYLAQKAEDVLEHYGFKLDKTARGRLLYFILRDNLGFGKIDPLMHDPSIEDISCDGTGINIYVWHRKYEYVPTNVRFDTTEELNSYALRLAYLCGSHVSIAQPMLDSSLPDGSRLNLTYGTEITRRGSTFTIRKFKADPLTIIDLIDYNTVNAEVAAYFWYAVENRVSIMVSGGIAAGKTTMLNCLSMFIKPDMKIVSIEDTPELNLPHENWIPAATRAHIGLGTEATDIGLFELLKASLRQRPDYIIVGEVRGAEAYTLFQAMSTGHLGMCTLHAESVESAVYRLESEPMNVPRTLISGIDMITIQKRVEQTDRPTRKTVTASEIVGLDPRSKEILTNEVFKWNPTKDTFEYTGRSYLVERIAEKKGITTDAANEEIQRRVRVLEWMRAQNVRKYLDVSDVIRRYYENPERVYKEAISTG